jgi:outer membrane protein TolC
MMKKLRYTGVIILLLGCQAIGRAQSLQQVIAMAQDSAITAFQSRYEYDSRKAQYAEFEALRKPQLYLDVAPNYQRVISDPARNFVYLRNYDRLSALAQLKLSQKMVNWGGEAYVGTQAMWSEYFSADRNNYPRDFVATPVLLGYRQTLLGYNPYRWEKLVEDQRLKAASQQHSYELHLIAEEATRRFFRLACAQGILDMCERNKQTADTLYAIAKEKASIAMVTLAELRSLELQRLNASNALFTARNEEKVARQALMSYLKNDTLSLRMIVPDNPQPLTITTSEALQMAKANSPAYQHQKVLLMEASHQQEKANKEKGVNVGLDVSLGLQQVGSNFAESYRNQQFYMLGAVTVSVPLMDHGAAKKRYEAATAWTAREASALDEVERALCEDVITTMQNLQSHQLLLENTAQAVTMADEVFELNAENYANGICDINTYSLAQNRRDNAYNQHLTALEKYWTTYYHLLTLTQHE